MITLSLCLAASLLVLLFLSRRGAGGPALPHRQSIECLEPRIAPAALAVSFRGGNLKITGDAASDSVELIQGPGGIEVMDGLTSLGTFAEVKNITAKLEGPTALLADLAANGIRGSMKVTADGPATVELAAGSSIEGRLSFIGDSADQILTLGSGVTIGKTLTFKGGAGTDSFSIGASSVIGGKTSFKDMEGGDFQATSIITIEGKLDFKNAGTALPVDITTTGLAGINVSGPLSYTGGKGNDVVFLAGSFDGNAAFTDKSGSNGFSLGQNSVVHGALRVTTGAGNDSFNFQGGTVDKDMVLKLGDGNNEFRYGIAAQVNIVKSFTFTTGSGNDLWQTGGPALKVGKNLNVKLGDGMNTAIASVTVDGSSVAITTGNARDVISIDGSAANAHLKVKLNNGDDDLAGSLFRLARSARYDGGKGMDHFFENTVIADPVIITSFEDFS